VFSPHPPFLSKNSPYVKQVRPPKRSSHSPFSSALFFSFPLFHPVRCGNYSAGERGRVLWPRDSPSFIPFPLPYRKDPFLGGKNECNVGFESPPPFFSPHAWRFFSLPLFKSGLKNHGGGGQRAGLPPSPPPSQETLLPPFLLVEGLGAIRGPRDPPALFLFPLERLSFFGREHFAGERYGRAGRACPVPLLGNPFFSFPSSLKTA